MKCLPRVIDEGQICRKDLPYHGIFLKALSSRKYWSEKGMIYTSKISDNLAVLFYNKIICTTDNNQLLALMITLSFGYVRFLGVDFRKIGPILEFVYVKC